MFLEAEQDGEEINPMRIIPFDQIDLPSARSALDRGFALNCGLHTATGLARHDEYESDDALIHGWPGQMPGHGDIIITALDAQQSAPGYHRSTHVQA